ncbi:MAG: U32 family peptidase, partial [Actinomycetia bacterium]|nr:U32 family peptidase [Actinomycetes bacterium]
MTENKSKIELVAPAGGPGQLTAALNAGADSIYLGYKQYGARAYAENFDFKQLRKAVDRAHGRGVKIYLTLNTIIKNDEIPDIVYFLNNYLDICNDGIIIQDMGLCRILMDLFPDVPIHASTQINIHNSSSLDFFGSAGVRRAVLAREMALKEIKSLSNTTEVDIEIFGHGSQCFCYSGSCYLSSFTGGRSGNRGRCSQPCRM